MPGILMAAWVRSLREPTRGMSEGLVSAAHPAPFRLLGSELASVLPPLHFIGLARSRASVVLNLAAAAGIALLAWWLIHWTGSVAQWRSAAGPPDTSSTV